MSNASNAYAGFFKVWPKMLGVKPTAEQLATIHALGARPGKQALANAMMLRPEGATAPQIVVACGAGQINKMREFCHRKVVERNMNMPKSEAGHTVYKITLTAKGEGLVKKANDAAVEPAEKPAKVSKARKTKGKSKPKADVPASEPAAPTSEPVSEPQGEPAPAVESEPVTA